MAVMILILAQVCRTLAAMNQLQQSPRAAGLWVGLRGWAARLRARAGARQAERQAAHRLYRALVNQARSQRFFCELGVPDTPEGRFEIVGLHAALLLRRLRSEGAAGQALGQALFDLMFDDMDASLRELGVGDLSVGRQVKRLAGQFYARLAALDQVIGPGAASLVEPVLRANVWHGGPPPSAAQVAALAEHLIACERRLGGQSGCALLRGEVTFARAEA
jgi:cytochrome b pre-mRNA-processing protein 3